MTTLPSVESNASESNPVEDYPSEGYSNFTGPGPESNVVESVPYDALSDVLIDEDVPALEAPTIDHAENATEQQSVVVEAVGAGATLEPELIAVEAEEDTMSEWSEEEDEDVIYEIDTGEEYWFDSEFEDEDMMSEGFEEVWEGYWFDSEFDDEDMMSEGFEEASEDEGWVAADEEGLAIPVDFAPGREEPRRPAGDEVVVIEDDSAQLGLVEPWAPLLAAGPWAVIEEPAEEAVDAVFPVGTTLAATAPSHRL